MPWSVGVLDRPLEAVEGVAGGRGAGRSRACLTAGRRARRLGAAATLRRRSMDGRGARRLALRAYMPVSAGVRARPKPFIGAIHGYALAGGFELALICDVRFAARRHQFGLPDTPLGLSPRAG